MSVWSRCAGVVALSVSPHDFPDFTAPGYGKVMWSFTTHPYGERRTLVSSKIRVTLTNPQAWLNFRRYWRISTPAVSVISRAVLRTVKHNAEDKGHQEPRRRPAAAR